MKKYLSVPALDVRITVYKMFVILLLVSAVQLADFYCTMQMLIQEFTENGWLTADGRQSEPGMPIITFDRILEECHMQVIFAIALAATGGLLLWAAASRCKGKSRQHLWRLCTPNSHNFLMFALYHVLCFGMVIVTEMITVIGMYKMHQVAAASGSVPQGLLMAFYRNRFLHGLYPMADWFGTLKLLCFVLTWGLFTAYMGHVGFGTDIRIKGLVLGYVAVFMGVLMVCGIEVFWLECLTVCAGFVTSGYMIASGIGVFGEVYDEGMAKEG